MQIALRAKRFYSVALSASSLLKTLLASHLHGRRDARSRVNRSYRTPTQFKRLSWRMTDEDDMAYPCWVGKT
jgi:hypothetical protein